MSPTTMTMSATMISPDRLQLAGRVGPAGAVGGEPPGPELQFRAAQAHPVAWLDPDRDGPLYPLSVEPGPVRAVVGQPGLVEIEVQPQLQVRPGDGGVVDQQPVPLVDAGALPADDQPVVDRRRPLLVAVRGDDEHGRNARWLRRTGRRARRRTPAVTGASAGPVSWKTKTCRPMRRLQPGGSGLGSVPIRVHSLGAGRADVGPVGRGGVTDQHGAVLDDDVRVHARDHVVRILQQDRRGGAALHRGVVVRVAAEDVGAVQEDDGPFSDLSTPSGVCAATVGRAGGRAPGPGPPSRVRRPGRARPPPGRAGWSRAGASACAPVCTSMVAACSRSRPWPLVAGPARAGRAAPRRLRLVRRCRARRCRARGAATGRGLGRDRSAGAAGAHWCAGCGRFRAGGARGTRRAPALDAAPGRRPAPVPDPGCSRAGSGRSPARAPRRPGGPTPDRAAPAGRRAADRQPLERAGHDLVDPGQGLFSGQLRGWSRPR